MQHCSRQKYRLSACRHGYRAFDLLGLRSLEDEADYHAWLTARPMGTAIDLSQPCEISLPFQQTCSISHGEGLYLQCDVETKLQAEPENLLKGLSGVVVFKDSDGRQIDTVKFDDKRARYWDDKILLSDFLPFRIGTYVAVIRVDSGRLRGWQKTDDLRGISPVRFGANACDGCRRVCAGCWHHRSRFCRVCIARAAAMRICAPPSSGNRVTWSGRGHGVSSARPQSDGLPNPDMGPAANVLVSARLGDHRGGCAAVSA